MVIEKMSAVLEQKNQRRKETVESTCWGIIEMSGKDLQGVVHLVVYLPIHCHRKVFGCTD